MADLKGTKTEANLKAAFAGESQARNRYTYFASAAKKEGYEQISAVFLETAENEKEHAKRFFKLLEGGAVEVNGKGSMLATRSSIINPNRNPGISQEEIDQLVKDAELHAEDDRQKKELIDARNAADTLVYTTEKSIAELGDKINAATKTEVEQAIADLKQVMDGEDVAEIKRRTETLTHASHRLAESAYQQSGPAHGQHGNQSSNAGTSSGSSGNDDNVVDAEFEEVA